MRPERCLIVLALGLLTAGCAGTRPTDLGVADGRLSACPSSPNCVTSLPTDALHQVAAFEIVGDPGSAWRAAREAVLALPRTTLVIDDAGYLHAECTSALMRYVDDLELHLDGRVIQVRSASRVGYGDMGVNRERVENLRAALVTAGVVRPTA